MLFLYPTITHFPVVSYLTDFTNQLPISDNLVMTRSILPVHWLWRWDSHTIPVASLITPPPTLNSHSDLLRLSSSPLQLCISWQCFKSLLLQANSWARYQRCRRGIQAVKSLECSGTLPRFHFQWLKFQWFDPLWSVKSSQTNQSFAYAPCLLPMEPSGSKWRIKTGCQIKYETGVRSTMNTFSFL